MEPTGEDGDVSETRKPEYLAYAKSANGRWIRIGVAWNNRSKEDRPYTSINIDSLPFNFDGSVTLFPIGQEP